MKDSDQKDDYYSVSKQPTMPMGAPPPPAPMGMPMGMPPMGGPMPPGAPMAPQEEELQEGEYIDPMTGKVMRRGEEFNVDPDQELDDPKKITNSIFTNTPSWFDTIRKRSAAPPWSRAKNNREIGGYDLRHTYDISGGNSRMFGPEEVEEGFIQDGTVHETTPALANMMRGREIERYGNRVRNLEGAKAKQQAENQPSRLQRLMGKKPPEFTYREGKKDDAAYWTPYLEEDLQDARKKLEAAKQGGKTYSGSVDYGEEKNVDYGSEGHIIDRMPHPEVEGEDSFGTMEGGAGYGQGGYTALYEDTPDWFKNVQG